MGIPLEIIDSLLSTHTYYFYMNSYRTKIPITLTAAVSYAHEPRYSAVQPKVKAYGQAGVPRTLQMREGKVSVRRVSQFITICNKFLHFACLLKYYIIIKQDVTNGSKIAFFPVYGRVGKKAKPRNIMLKVVHCHNCNGTGSLKTIDDCTVCHGVGTYRVVTRRTIRKYNLRELNIPRLQVSLQKKM